MTTIKDLDTLICEKAHRKLSADIERVFAAFTAALPETRYGVMINRSTLFCDDADALSWDSFTYRLFPSIAAQLKEGREREAREEFLKEVATVKHLDALSQPNDGA
jgi:hypothetical protein